MIVHFMVSRFFDHKVTESCLCDHQLGVCKTSSVREADGAEYGKGTEVRGYGGTEVRGYGGTDLQRHHELVPLGRRALAAEDLQEEAAARARHRLLGAGGETSDVGRGNAGLDEQGDAHLLR